MNISTTIKAPFQGVNIKGLVSEYKDNLTGKRVNSLIIDKDLKEREQISRIKDLNDKKKSSDAVFKQQEIFPKQRDWYKSIDAVGESMDRYIIRKERIYNAALKRLKKDSYDYHKQFVNRVGSPDLVEEPLSPESFNEYNRLIDKASELYNKRNTVLQEKANNAHNAYKETLNKATENARKFKENLDMFNKEDASYMNIQRKKIDDATRSMNKTRWITAGSVIAGGGGGTAAYFANKDK